MDCSGVLMAVCWGCGNEVECQVSGLSHYPGIGWCHLLGGENKFGGANQEFTLDFRQDVDAMSNWRGPAGCGYTDLEFGELLGRGVYLGPICMRGI